MGEGLLSSFPVTVRFPIAWGEMDFFQHVNNILYFRYFENARIAYFEKIGLMELARTTGIGPILAQTECTFRKPLTYPDEVVIGARISAYEPERFTHEYCIVSNKLGKIAAEGSAVIVAYDHHKKKKALFPETLKHAIEALEARVF